MPVQPALDEAKTGSSLEVLSFTAEGVDCQPFIHNIEAGAGIEAPYCIFSMHETIAACGVLFMDTMSDIQGFSTSGSKFTLIHLDYDLDRTSDSELRALSSLDTWQGSQRRFPLGSTLFVMLVRQNEEFWERVAVGKIFAAAWPRYEASDTVSESSGTSTRDSGYGSSLRDSIYTSKPPGVFFPVSSVTRRFFII